jgi:hypothetical protein
MTPWPSSSEMERGSLALAHDPSGPARRAGMGAGRASAPVWLPEHRDAGVRGRADHARRPAPRPGGAAAPGTHASGAAGVARSAFRRVLASHGEPVPDRAAYERALDDELRVGWPAGGRFREATMRIELMYTALQPARNRSIHSVSGPLGDLSFAEIT